MSAGFEDREELLRTLSSAADYIRLGASRFNAAGLHFGHGTDRAADEARQLVLHALHLDQDTPEYLLAGALATSEKEMIIALFERRVVERVPAPYLTGAAWFAGLPFYVDQRVLVPRSPLAELIETGFAPWKEAGRVARVLDLCTGSGCIAIACAYAFPAATVDATEISDDALAVARINVARHGVEDRVRLVRADLFSGLADERYDVIVGNPPYVSPDEYARLPAEYRHEPRVALQSGQDGLAVVRAILNGARRHLEDDGVLIVEVGAAAEAVAAQWPELAFTWLEFEHGGEGVFLLQASELDATLAATG